VGLTRVVGAVGTRAWPHLEVRGPAFRDTPRGARARHVDRFNFDLQLIWGEAHKSLPMICSSESFTCVFEAYSKPVLVRVVREKTGVEPWLFLIVLTELSRDQTPESRIQVRPLVRPGS
jgi:hypothetical protein